MLKKKKIILAAIAFVVIIIGSILGYQYIEKNKSTGTDWADIYLEYLQDMSNAENKKIFFMETEFSLDPMLVAYDDIGDGDMRKFSISLYIIEDGEVKNIANKVGNLKAEIKFMYDVKRDKYDYFLYENFDGSKTYESIDSVIIDTIVSDIVSEENLNAEDRSRREKEEYSKYDNYSKYYISRAEDSNKELSYVVDTGMKIQYFEYKKDPEYLFDSVKELVNSYQKNQDLMVEYEDTVKKQLENISHENDTEPEKLSFTVGTYTLKYGKYKTCFDDSNCSEFILNQDGTAIFDGKSKYFRVEDYNFAQGVIEYQTGQNIYPAIVISDTKNGNTGIRAYTPYVTSTSCLMTDAEIECVNYIGD